MTEDAPTPSPSRRPHISRKAVPPLSHAALLIVSLVALVVAIAWGIGMYHLQAINLAALRSGVSLSGLNADLARGSTAGTAWEGWVAALLFAAVAVRMGTGSAEAPPALREATSAADLREHARREERWAQRLLMLVGLCALLDGGRLAIYLVFALTGNSLGQSNVGLIAIEAFGWICAAAAMAWCSSCVTEQRMRWGA